MRCRRLHAHPTHVQPRSSACCIVLLVHPGLPTCRAAGTARCFGHCTFTCTASSQVRRLANCMLAKKPLASSGVCAPLPSHPNFPMPGAALLLSSALSGSSAAALPQLPAGCAAGMMVDSALTFAPQSYRLWLVAVRQQQRWQEASLMLQRGILALCKPLPAAAEAPGSGARCGLPEQQAASALDLGLRLLQLLGSAGHDESRAAQLEWAATDVANTGGGGRQAPLLHRSKAALLAELQAHPRLLCTLCCCCAFAAAHGRLPPAAEHSLGYLPPPLAALLREWPAAPHPLPAGAPSAAATACRAALVVAADSLGLLGFSVKSKLKQERAKRLSGCQLSSQQCQQQAVAFGQLALHQGEALRAAQACLALAMLRLDSLAAAGSGGIGKAATTFMAAAMQYKGLGPAELATAGLTTQHQASLKAALQCWGRLPKQQEQGELPLQPPVEMLLLLQEVTVAAASAAAATASTAAAKPAAAEAEAAGASGKRKRAGSGGPLNPMLLACLHGRLHPAAAAALAVAVAGSRQPQAPMLAAKLLECWALGYAKVRSRDCSWPHIFSAMRRLAAASACSAPMYSLWCHNLLRLHCPISAAAGSPASVAR